MRSARSLPSKPKRGEVELSYMWSTESGSWKVASHDDLNIVGNYAGEEQKEE